MNGDISLDISNILSMVCKLKVYIILTLQKTCLRDQFSNHYEGTWFSFLLLPVMNKLHLEHSTCFVPHKVLLNLHEDILFAMVLGHEQQTKHFILVYQKNLKMTYSRVNLVHILYCLISQVPLEGRTCGAIVSQTLMT